MHTLGNSAAFCHGCAMAARRIEAARDLLSNGNPAQDADTSSKVTSGGKKRGGKKTRRASTWQDVARRTDRAIKQESPGVITDDEAADILGDMPEEDSQELLSLMEKDEAKEVQDLLNYEDDTAGGLMTSEFLDFPPEATIDEAMASIRLLVPDVEFIYYIYVVDGEDHLLGVITIKKLLTSPLYITLGEIMTKNVKCVHLDTERKEIAEMISKYDIIAVPVLDDEEKIRGVITVDDIIDLFVPNPTRRRKKRAFQ